MSVEFLEQLEVNVVKLPESSKKVAPGVTNFFLNQEISVPNTSKPTNIEPIDVKHEFYQFQIFPAPHPLFGVM